MVQSMNERRGIVKLKRFPLEAEAVAAVAQCELTRLSHEDLLQYAQQATLIMSQLRHYSSELISEFEKLGYAIQSENPSG